MRYVLTYGVLLFVFITGILVGDHDKLKVEIVDCSSQYNTRQ